MAGIEPTPSKSECDWTPLSPLTTRPRGRLCLISLIKLICMLCIASHDSIQKSTWGGTRVKPGSSVGYNLFIELNQLISRSEKLINRSGVTPEQRNHMLGAVWSSSLSEGCVRREKRCGKWQVGCKKPRWNVPDHSEEGKMLKAEKERSGFFSLGRKILGFIDAGLKNQVIGLQLAA